MMKPSILLQLDTDPQPSVFDAVVAVDAGVDHLFRHGGVTPANVRDLVYGRAFHARSRRFATHGDLHRRRERRGRRSGAVGREGHVFRRFPRVGLARRRRRNTTAAAAVLAALEGGGSLSGVPTAVLAATGPVGPRVARLLGRLGAKVAVGSPLIAPATAATLGSVVNAEFTPFSTATSEDLMTGLSNAAAGGRRRRVGRDVAAGVGAVAVTALKVAIDLNAVPPLGIEGVKSGDKARDRDGVKAWARWASAV